MTKSLATFALVSAILGPLFVLALAFEAWLSNKP